MVRACWMTQFAQRFCFYLTNTLTGYIELLAYFFQSMVGIHINAESHTQYFSFTGCQAAKNFLGSFAQALVQ